MVRPRAPDRDGLSSRVRFSRKPRRKCPRPHRFPGLRSRPCENGLRKIENIVYTCVTTVLCARRASVMNYEREIFIEILFKCRVNNHACSAYVIRRDPTVVDLTNNGICITTGERNRADDRVPPTIPNGRNDTSLSIVTPRTIRA